MLRWHLDKPHMRRQRDLRRRWWPHSGRMRFGWHRKKRLFDCGNTACSGCHQDKYPVRQLTKQELDADKKFKESTEEFLGEDIVYANIGGWWFRWDDYDDWDYEIPQDQMKDWVAAYQARQKQFDELFLKDKE